MTTAIEKTQPATLPARMKATAEEAEAHAESVIAQYTGWAIAIMRTVEANHLYEPIRDKKYLEFDAWQLIGSLDRCYVDTRDTTPVIENGETTGYVCHAKLTRDGVLVGGAMQFCGLDAFPCRGKEGTAKDNAAMSAAQTWAGSKALRMRYSVVALLGGYGAATGDEMRRAQEEAPDKTQHWCEPHETNWFKRGKMRNFAHPIGDSKEWCNEPSEPKATVQPVVEGELVPDSDMAKDQLKEILASEEMSWDQFEIQVLRASWDAWVKRKGTPASAFARYNTWKEQSTKS